MLNTPGGRMWFMISQMRSTARGLPRPTSPPPNCRRPAQARPSAPSAASARSWMIAPTTPSGSRTVTESTLGRRGRICPFSSDPRPPKNLKTSATTPASTRIRCAGPCRFRARSGGRAHPHAPSRAARTDAPVPRLRADLAQSFCASRHPARRHRHRRRRPQRRGDFGAGRGVHHGEVLPDRAGT